MNFKADFLQANQAIQVNQARQAIQRIYARQAIQIIQGSQATKPSSTSTFFPFL